MNTTPRRVTLTRVLCLALPICMVLGLALVVVGVTGYFRLSRDAQCLRDSLTSTMGLRPEGWSKRIEVRVGALTCQAVRAGLSFVRFDPEARTALRAVRGGEIGVYQLAMGSRLVDHSAMLDAADKAMARRGWDRLVGVSKENEFVVIYVPKSASVSSLRACLAVLNEHSLVVVSARSNLDPLMELAFSRPAWKNQSWLPAQL